MGTPKELAAEVERGGLPEPSGWERFRGYAVAGVPFSSGHILAMRRFPVSSVGPGYTSVWHRDPSGRWAIYQDQRPEQCCPRVFGPAIDESFTVPIDLDWTGPNRLQLGIDTEVMRLHWEMSLVSSPVTRSLNAAASVMPRSLRQNPVALGALGRMAGPLLRIGRVRLAGRVPSKQNFVADLRRIWLIEEASATINGDDLGTLGPLPEQTHLSDFWLPQRGLFAFADAFFENYDPDRHEQVASRQG